MLQTSAVGCRCCPFYACLCRWCMFLDDFCLAAAGVCCRLLLHILHRFAYIYVLFVEFQGLSFILHIFACLNIFYVHFGWWFPSCCCRPLSTSAVGRCCCLLYMYLRMFMRMFMYFQWFYVFSMILLYFT